MKTKTVPTPKSVYYIASAFVFTVALCNLGGSTIIYIDDLAPFGNIAWSGVAREITFDF